MMRIYIPSRGRWTPNEIRRGPLPLLPAQWLEQTTILVPGEEHAQYEASIMDVLGGKLPTPVIVAVDCKGIAEKRTFIGELADINNYNKFMMLDDDIRFLRRKSDFSASQMTMTDPWEVGHMLAFVEALLDQYVQVGLGFRELNKTGLIGPPPLIEECGKCMRAVAYKTKVFRSVDTKRVQTMSDYDTTLQILEKGFKNAIAHFWMSGQGSTQAPGGCSIWRTNDVHERSVDRMVELHPGVVKKRTKTTKGGGEFGHRSELTIYWKKAYQRGVENAIRLAGLGDQGLAGASHGGVPGAN